MIDNNLSFNVPEPADYTEIPDYFIEQRFAIYELEIRMWWHIGKVLSKENRRVQIQIARAMHKHWSEIIAAIKFYKKYPKFEYLFDKSTTWAKIKKEMGEYETRNRPRIKEIKKRIIERKKKHQEELTRAPNDIYKKFLTGRISEDEAVIKELFNEEPIQEDAKK